MGCCYYITTVSIFVAVTRYVTDTVDITIVGVMGGNPHTAIGGGVGYLCLPLNPQWLSFNYSALDVAWMSAVEYESQNYGLFPNSVDNTRAVCARCYTEERPSVMMIPARTSCPDAWELEYYGYLMASRGNRNESPSNFVCVHYSPITRPYSSPDQGATLEFVNADCSGDGSIEECADWQYIPNRQLTCAVCSR